MSKKRINMLKTLLLGCLFVVFQWQIDVCPAQKKHESIFLQEQSNTKQDQQKIQYFNVSRPEEIEKSLKEQGFFDEKNREQNSKVLFFSDFDGVLFLPGGFTMDTIDKKYAKLLGKIKDAGIKIAGLTKRPYIKSLSEPCFGFFDELFGGFNLLSNYSGQPLIAGRSYFSQRYNEWFQSLFIKSVFHIGNENSKGKAMSILLEALQKSENISPEDLTIIFADDYKEFLEDIESACMEAGVKHYLAYHYTITKKEALKNTKESFKTKEIAEKKPTKQKTFFEIFMNLFSKEA